MTDGREEIGNGGYTSENNDGEDPILEYYRSQGPYVQPAPSIPEDWVQSCIDLPLTQLRSCRSNQVRMVSGRAVTILQESILVYGYSDTGTSVIVRALPRSADSVAADEPGITEIRQVYEVLDGHHRFAALMDLQARNLLPREFVLPVTVVRGTVPGGTLLAYQLFVNRAVEIRDEGAANVLNIANIHQIK